MEEVDKEISEMKLSLNARARVVAESYLLAVRTNYFLHDTVCAHSTPCSSTHEALHTFSVSTSLTRVICNIFWNATIPGAGLINRYYHPVVRQGYHTQLRQGESDSYD